MICWTRSCLTCDDGDIAHLQTRGRRHEQGGIECHPLAPAGRLHIVPVNRPGRVDLFHNRLQLRLPLLAPTVLLEGWLIDKAVPRVGHQGTVGKFDREWSTFRAGEPQAPVVGDM